MEQRPHARGHCYNNHIRSPVAVLSPNVGRRAALVAKDGVVGSPMAVVVRSGPGYAPPMDPPAIPKPTADIEEGVPGRNALDASRADA